MKQILAFSILCGLALSSCSTSKDPLANSSRAQFLDEVWVAPSIKGKALSELYGSVYFAPVYVGTLKKQGWWASQTLRTQDKLAADAQELAAYMHEALEKEARQIPNAPLRVVASPGPDTLVVETAITELVPSKVFWNSVASAAGFVVPGAGMLGTAGKGAIGIQGRLRDGKTGEILALFRDRRSDKFAVANVAAYTWHHGSKGNIDELAQKTAEILNAPADKVVTSSLPLKLVAF